MVNIISAFNTFFFSWGEDRTCGNGSLFMLILQILDQYTKCVWGIFSVCPSFILSRFLNTSGRSTGNVKQRLLNWILSHAFSVLFVNKHKQWATVMAFTNFLPLLIPTTPFWCFSIFSLSFIWHCVSSHSTSQYNSPYIRTVKINQY